VVKSLEFSIADRAGTSRGFLQNSKTFFAPCTRHLRANQPVRITLVEPLVGSPARVINSATSRKRWARVLPARTSCAEQLLNSRAPSVALLMRLSPQSGARWSGRPTSRWS